MRHSLSIGLICLLPGCAMFSNDCSREAAALRAADSAIADASRTSRAGFFAQMPSRGHASYHCVSGQSDHVRCTQADAPKSVAHLADLHHKRDVLAARAARLCGA